MRSKILKMQPPKFSTKQEEWLCSAIDEWYCFWKSKIGNDSRFGLAKENLKSFIRDDVNFFQQLSEAVFIPDKD